MHVAPVAALLNLRRFASLMVRLAELTLAGFHLLYLKDQAKTQVTE